MAKVAFIYTEYVDDNPKYGELLIRVFRNNKYDATLCSPQQQVTFETIQKMQPDLLFFEIALNSNEAGRKLLDSCTMDESLNRMPIIIASDGDVTPALAAHLNRENKRLLARPVYPADIGAALKEIDAAWDGPRDQQDRPIRRQAAASSCCLIPIAIAIAITAIVALLALLTNRH